MKKYRISKFYVGIYIIGLVYGLFGIVFGIYLAIDSVEWTCILLFIVGFIVVIGILYQLLFDFQAGKFSVNKQGITMYIGFKEWPHKWEDFKDCGIVGAYVGNGSIYWCYFSTRFLTLKERKVFLKKTRRDLANVAFFQYHADMLQEILPQIPPEMSSKLQECIQQLNLQMTWIEKIHHKLLLYLL